MNAMKPGSLIAVIVFVVVFLGHLLRLLFHIEVTVGGGRVPMWSSILGCLVPAGVAILLWKEARES